jgi:hypothetical protein
MSAYHILQEQYYLNERVILSLKAAMCRLKQAGYSHKRNVHAPQMLLQTPEM